MNRYVYTYNNPIMYADDGGNRPVELTEVNRNTMQQVKKTTHADLLKEYQAKKQLEIAKSQDRELRRIQQIKDGGSSYIQPENTVRNQYASKYGPAYVNENVYKCIQDIYDDKEADLTGLTNKELEELRKMADDAFGYHWKNILKKSDFERGNLGLSSAFAMLNKQIDAQLYSPSVPGEGDIYYSGEPTPKVYDDDTQMVIDALDYFDNEYDRNFLRIDDMLKDENSKLILPYNKVHNYDNFETFLMLENIDLEKEVAGSLEGISKEYLGDAFIDAMGEKVKDYAGDTMYMYEAIEIYCNDRNGYDGFDKMDAELQGLDIEGGSYDYQHIAAIIAIPVATKLFSGEVTSYGLYNVKLRISTDGTSKVLEVYKLYDTRTMPASAFDNMSDEDWRKYFGELD